MKAISENHPGVLATLVAFGLIFPLLLISSCGGDSSNNPVKNGKTYLAGGGRFNDTDEFRGGPGGSGPNDTIPNVPPDTMPSTKYQTLFSGEVGCQVITENSVITNKADWEQFWDRAISCSFGWQHRGGFPLGDSGITDSVWFPPDSVMPAPPEVDFSRDVVVAMIVDPDSARGKNFVLTNVTTSGGGTKISYLVCYPDSDCYVLMDPIPWDGDTVYLAAAFAVPKFSPDNLVWERKDTTYSCSWHPDPKEPLTLYYTDAPCDLGDGEQVITNKADFEAWTAKAFECDRKRWEGGTDTLANGGDTVVVNPGDTTAWPPQYYDFNVDFSRCAVIILRAGEQTRWGGGIWLKAFNSTDGGTSIEYSVLEPGSNCPEIGSVPWYSGNAINPTVAIQVPLPINDPIKWNRKIETIDCNWNDSTWVDGRPGKR